MLGKLLLLVLIVGLVYVLLKQYRRSMDPPKGPAAASQDMVRCAVCGVHLPKSESLRNGDEHYCCEQHRDQMR